MLSIPPLFLCQSVLGIARTIYSLPLRIKALLCPCLSLLCFSFALPRSSSQRLCTSRLRHAFATPCYQCHCFAAPCLALLGFAFALRHQSYRIHAFPSPFDAWLCLCLSMPGFAFAFRCLALPLPFDAWLCLCLSMPGFAFAFRCLALPLLDFSLHPIAAAKLCSSFPSHFFTEHRLRTSISSLPLLRSASLFPCNSQLFIAFAYRGCAKPSHIKAPDCIAKAIALPLLGSSIQGLCCSNQCETQPLQVISLLFVSTPRQISARLNKAVAKLRKSLPSPLVAVPFRCTSFMCSAVPLLI